MHKDYIVNNRYYSTILLVQNLQKTVAKLKFEPDTNKFCFKSHFIWNWRGFYLKHVEMISIAGRLIPKRIQWQV